MSSKSVLSQLSGWLYKLFKPVQPDALVVKQPILSQQAINQLGESLSQMVPKATLNPKASESLKQGEQGSRFLGSGMEYEESRLYQPGDEVRRINWRLMARTGQAYTKLFQEERQESWTLLVDQRQSMRFGTQQRLKVTQAVRVAGYYAWQAQTAGLPIDAIRLSENVKSTPIFEGRSSFEQLMEFLSIPQPPMTVQKEPRLHDELLECQKRLQVGSRLIIISDFQDLDDATLNVMAALQQKVMLKAVLVYDAVEKHLPAISGLKLKGLSGRTQAHSLTHQDYQAYETWAQQYFETLRQKLSNVGVTLIEISTQDDLLKLHNQPGSAQTAGAA
ncbi:DUF58 domain-containing protein [Hydrogenovibrio kuenenii]|uniref:DUF58 domain-containing protein n=1 Tax=Hydrogenovibrio kuenenii TaxID=63658 RepID=UPI000467037D|nr:DUF58 domain-containing protein [Hydrogenovibrio kuenenii]